MVVKEEYAAELFPGGPPQLVGALWQDMENGFLKETYMEELTGYLGDLEDVHQAYFDNEAGPSGSKWPVLAESTIKKKGHDRILIDTTELHTSLTSNSTSAVRIAETTGGTTSILSFGTSVEYSAFHNEEDGPLPQREHVGINDGTLQPLLNEVADKTVEALKVKI